MYLPEDFAILDGKTVEVTVVGANQDSVTQDHWRRFDFAAGLVGPGGFAILDIDGVESAGEVSDKYESAADSGRGFTDAFFGFVLPLWFAGSEVDRCEFRSLRADVHDAISDGGGGLDGITCFVSPE